MNIHRETHYDMLILSPLIIVTNGTFTDSQGTVNVRYRLTIGWFFWSIEIDL